MSHFFRQFGLCQSDDAQVNRQFFIGARAVEAAFKYQLGHKFLAGFGHFVNIGNDDGSTVGTDQFATRHLAAVFFSEQ